MEVLKVIEFGVTGAWYVFLAFCALAILGFVFHGAALSFAVAKRLTEPLFVMPSVKFFLGATVFVLILPLGCFIGIILFADKSKTKPTNEQVKKRNSGRPVSGSIVSDVMIFDGDVEKIRMAKKWRNMFF